MRHHLVGFVGFALGLGWLASSAGCTSVLPMTTPPVERPVEIKDLPVVVNRNIDLLFLIDDSPSMADKQANLAANFPKLLGVLDTIQGGLPNVHIGVATSDLGTKGADDPQPGPSIGTPGNGGCIGLGKNGALQLSGAAVAAGTYLSDIQQADGARIKNYTGNLSDVFARMAKVGAGGCGFEQHLEAVRLALDPANPANTGFVRPDALLAIVIIADEDDCSVTHSSLFAAGDTGPFGPQQSFRCTRFGVVCDQNGATPDAMNAVGPKSQCHPDTDATYLTSVSTTAAFVKGLKSDPRNVIVAALAGTTEPFAVELRAPSGTAAPIPALAHSCVYVDGDGKPELADPAIRIKSFLDQFPDRSAFAPICQQDLSGSLQQIGELLRTAIGDPCIEGKLSDVDPKAAGPQYDCAVSTVLNPATESEIVMPRCTPEDGSATNAPCWHLVTDPASCPRSDHLLVKIEGEEMLPRDAHVVAKCAIDPK